jgi:uncharacterized damage-inducible protein DinB
MTKVEYLAWFTEVLQPTEPTFRLIPHDKVDFKLTERSFSLGQLLGHIPGSLAFFAKVVNNEELPFKSMREIMVANRRQPSVGVDEGIRFLQSSVSTFENAVGRLSDDQFQSALLDTPQKGRVSYWRYCAFALEHHIHHLMEMHVCLRVLGVDVNTKSLYVG